MVRFSAHALLRMSERKVTKQEVLEILTYKVKTVIYPSPKDKEIDLYFGRVNHKHWLVVFNRKKHNVITVRRMREDEKKIYEEAVK